MTNSTLPEIRLPSVEAATSNNVPEDVTGESSASETEYQTTLEVLVDEATNHRRKSSLVDSEALALARSYKNTACFIHTLLEGQHPRLNPKGQPPQQLLHRVVNHLQDDVETQSLMDGHRPDGQEASTHSRLLTKRQLSDMAWGVRELSKHLGGIRMKLHVRRVFILTKARDEALIHNTRELARWLLALERETPYTVYVEEILERNPKFDAAGLVAENPSVEGRLKYWNNEMCLRQPQLFDFVVTLGGDGTVLYASWLFQRIVPPVLSFALGSLGFLTKFDYSRFPETLTHAFHDGITVSLGLRFEGTVMRSRKNEHHQARDLVEELVGEESDDDRTHRPDGSFVIFNDIVVDRGPSPTMSSLELFGDEEHFTSIQADGVCVATPNGSTAYNLAAGGSLCHPENPVILVTAICAHTLSFRPIILPDTMVLRVGVPYDARTSSWASFDGRERLELQPGDYVTISASRYPFANVLPQGQRTEGWVSSIRRTLQWNSRQRQKPFTEWTQDGEKKN
ncbi:MAG: hypothetical protein M1823_006103 [Watsoniomyces obsoletus]|nr:MAG: hypothetical protein M1823_006103 [Watsoniomyces obsoletus]